MSDEDKKPEIKVERIPIKVKSRTLSANWSVSSGNREAADLIRKIKTVKDAILNSRHEDEEVRRHCAQILKTGKGYSEDEIRRVELGFHAYWPDEAVKSMAQEIANEIDKDILAKMMEIAKGEDKS